MQSVNVEKNIIIYSYGTHSMYIREFMQCAYAKLFQIVLNTVHWMIAEIATNLVRFFRRSHEGNKFNEIYLSLRIFICIFFIIHII